MSVEQSLATEKPPGVAGSEWRTMRPQAAPQRLHRRAGERFVFFQKMSRRQGWRRRGRLGMAGAPLALCLSRRPPLLLLLSHALSPPAVHAAHRQGRAKHPHPPLSRATSRYTPTPRLPPCIRPWAACAWRQRPDLPRPDTTQHLPGPETSLAAAACLPAAFHRPHCDPHHTPAPCTRPALALALALALVLARRTPHAARRAPHPVAQSVPVTPAHNTTCSLACASAFAPAAPPLPATALFPPHLRPPPFLSRAPNAPP